MILLSFSFVSKLDYNDDDYDLLQHKEVPTIWAIVVFPFYYSFVVDVVVNNISLLVSHFLMYKKLKFFGFKY